MLTTKHAKKRTADVVDDLEELHKKHKRDDQIKHLRERIDELEAEQKEGLKRMCQKICDMTRDHQSKTSLNSERMLFQLLMTGAFWELCHDRSFVLKCLTNPLFKLALRHWHPPSQEVATEFVLRVCEGVNHGEYPSVLARCPWLLRAMLGKWSPQYECEIPYKKPVCARFGIESYFRLAHRLSVSRKAQELPCLQEIGDYFANEPVVDVEEDSSSSESSSGESSSDDPEEEEDSSSGESDDQEEDIEDSSQDSDSK